MKQLTPIQWLKYIYETTGNLKDSDFDYANNWTKKNTFTEEQVREAYIHAYMLEADADEKENAIQSANYYIQSLKT
jgi:hypothetical protein